MGFYSVFLVLLIWSFSTIFHSKAKYTYTVKKLNDDLTIDGNWNKSQWKRIRSIEVSNFLGKTPEFRPQVEVKMMYDTQNIYLIFNVYERNFQCTVKDYNGPVWENSCVEFFFSPDNSLKERYFNLEISCGGTPLMHYNVVPRKTYREVEIADLKQIEIAHTLPQIIETEITHPVTWNIEYKIPLHILSNYSKVTPPDSGVCWRANYYKIAEKGSNPHWISWSPIEDNKVDFHLPEYFGVLRFE